MNPGERMWLWAQPLLAIVAAVAGVSAIAARALGEFSLLPSVQAVVTGVLVLPGLALSLGINHLIVRARRPARLTNGEKILLVLQVLIVFITVVTSLDQAALIGGYLLWPLLIAASVTACVTMARTTLALRRAGSASGADLVAPDAAPTR